jgi:hypothetical protein
MTVDVPERSAEHGPFPPSVLPHLRRDVARLRADLESARDGSALPARPSDSALAALDGLVVRTRLKTTVAAR